MTRKSLRKLIQPLFLMYYMLKKELPTTQITKKIIVLTNPNRQGWHYLSIKKLSALLRRVTSKHDADFYCLNCLGLFRTKNKHESHQKICEKNDFCSNMSFEDTKIGLN